MIKPTALPSPAAINACVLVLLTVSTLLQGVALIGVLPIAPDTFGRHVFSTLEMLLVAALLWQGWRIRQWSRLSAQTQETQLTATLCFYSLLFCGLGDLVNRNYLEQYYQWDTVIKHSYLINSVLFFYPGYLLVLVANWRLSRSHVGKTATVVGSLIAIVLGSAAFFNDYRADINPAASAIMLGYTHLHAVMALSAFWLIRTYGWPVSAVVVIGVLLASGADVLIGNFWIYRDYYPTIEHVNWIIYFSSLAMIQQLPFMVARSAKISR